jgi:hypothetical protein
MLATPQGKMRNRSASLGLVLAIIAIAAGILGMWGMDKRVTALEAAVRDSHKAQGKQALTWTGPHYPKQRQAHK